jgi:hypothetical protein
MARRTIIGGNWSDPNAWQEGIVPTIEDDVFWQEGDLTIDTNAECSTIDLTAYPDYLFFNDGTTLTIDKQIYLIYCSGLMLSNPVDKIIFNSSLVSVWYDPSKQVATFDNGLDIYLISYV